MGDRTYSRFSVPAGALVDPERRHALAEIFEIALEELEAILASDASTRESVAAHHNETALRLVENVPCVVLEDDQSNYGGSATVEDLVSCQIPFLHTHDHGCEFDAGVTVYAGHGEPVWVPCNDAGEFIAIVGITDERAVINPADIEQIDACLALTREVLAGHVGQPTSTDPS